jgi:hypothetical protein
MAEALAGCLRVIGTKSRDPGTEPPSACAPAVQRGDRGCRRPVGRPGLGDPLGRTVDAAARQRVTSYKVRQNCHSEGGRHAVLCFTQEHGADRRIFIRSGRISPSRGVLGLCPRQGSTRGEKDSSVAPTGSSAFPEARGWALSQNDRCFSGFCLSQIRQKPARDRAPRERQRVKSYEAR